MYVYCYLIVLFSSGGLVDRLPHYVFLTALPQLISRICHSNAEVFVQLCKIIATMISSYPQQSMWHMIAVSKVSDFQAHSHVLVIPVLINPFSVL